MDWLSLFLVILVVAITYILTIQGLVSALITAGLAILCAALAFGTFEWVAYTFLAGPLGELALPVALMATFVVPLLALRSAMDVLITRSSLLPVLIDRTVGTGLAFIAGFLMTGVLAVAVQMLPFDGTILGHTGLDPETGAENKLWLNLDRVTVGYAEMMSGGLFSGGRSWRDAHPDFMQEVLWNQAAPSGVSRFAPPGSIRVVHVDYPDYIFDKTKDESVRDATPHYERKNPPSGKRWYLVRIALADEARDSEETHQFSRRQVRLVGRDSPDAPPRNLATVAINDNDRPEMAVTIKDGKVYRPETNNEIDFLFEVPESHVPMYIAYKMGARADLSGHKPATQDATEPDPAAAPPTDSASRESTRAGSATRSASSTPGGRVSGARGSSEGGKFSDALPLTMTDFDSTGLERDGSRLGSGHLYGDVAKQGRAGRSDGIVKFDVPSDKRLFQLDVKLLQARSTLGRALSFAVTSLKNYQLRDDTGRQYPVVGQIAQANVDGVEVIEVQYYPEIVAVSSRGGLRDFRRIKKRHLQGNNYSLAYLFLVEPGARLTEFRTSPTRRPTDLKALGLVAPR